MSEEFIDKTLRPDLPDSRDYIFVASTSNLPTSVDLRPHAGEIENQLSTGSCVANATVSALEIILQKGGKFFDLSRLFLYYNLREPYSNLHGKDIGSYLRDGFKFVNKLGICSEKTWPFIPSQVNTEPSGESYAEALEHRVTRYERIPGFSSFADSDNSAILLLKAALAKGFPATISMSLGRTFYDLRNVDDLSEQDYQGLDGDSIGGHAMCVVGYDDVLEGFIVENSWGKDWGDNGYCLISYDVIKRDCNDVWVCSGFNGITLDPEWEDTSPELKLQSSQIDIFKGESREVTLSPTIVQGTPPYTFYWKHVIGFNGAGVFIGESGEAVENPTSETVTYRLNEDITMAGLQCRVTDSSSLKKKETGFVTVKYHNEPRPSPEPDDPVKPEPESPKEEKDDDKKKYIVGAVALIVFALLAYFNS